MNKIYNAWILIISLLTLPFAFFTGVNEVYGAWDVSLKDYAHRDFIFALSAGLILLIGVHRSVRKWAGIRIVNQKNKFVFNAEISTARRKRVILYNTIEIVFFFLLSIVFVLFSVYASIISLVFFLFIIDNFLNTLLGIYGKKYRIGITNKAIVAVDREVIAIYFKGLKRISFCEESLVFEYVNELVLELPFENVSLEDKEQFITVLKEKVDLTKVYVAGL
ncbi:MAG: hypothetical protein H3C31_10680 [Brumimicrobium sp.]|nr:hypothetical protein [Brumimicrobium sp.]